MRFVYGPAIWSILAKIDVLGKNVYSEVVGCTANMFKSHLFILFCLLSFTMVMNLSIVRLVSILLVNVTYFILFGSQFFTADENNFNVL